MVSARGELTGRLVAVQSETGAAANLLLPVESFVGAPQGDSLVYTSYSPALGSEVGLVDLASGCRTKLATPAEIVRSALVDPSGSFVYVHSVSHAGRADMGIERIDLATGAAALVVPPLAPSDAFGPTFATELRWSVDGSALAVQSCGFEACRTRVLDVASGAIATYDAPGQGALIGLTDAHLVTFADCAGIPCPALGIDLASGMTSVLADTALSASIVPVGDGLGTVAVETAAGTVEVTQ